MTRMGHDDLVRGLLNSRSARSGVPAAFSPTPTADAFSLVSPRPGIYTSPHFTERSESPSCYSRSQMSLDDMCSDISDNYPTTSTYRSRFDGREPRTVNMDKYRSYVDPMRDSSEDERTEGSDVQGSGSNETLSDTGMLRPVESDTSVSSALSDDTAQDPRLSFLGPKTRLISKAPWEEDGGANEEAVSDTEAADTLSMFAGKFKGKGRSRSRTLTQCKAEMERFLGGGWSRTSIDARPSMDSSKRSMESSVASYIQTPTSPRNGSFSDVIRGVGARTPSLFSASSATSPGAQAIRPRGGSSGAGVQTNAYHLDSRGPSPDSASPTTPNFVHPYANLDLLSAGATRDGEASPSRSNSSATLTASTVSSYVTPSSTSSSATSPEQHELPSLPKKEKHRPPHITVLPLSRGGSHASSVKSPSALSVSFIPLSPASMSTTSATQEDALPSGMLGFPGSPAYNLISLEQAQQAQMRARSRSITSNTTSPRPKEIVHKKSKPVLGPVGGGFSSTIAGGSPAPQWNAEEPRVRTVSAGSAPRNRPRGYTATSIASQSTTSVNVIPGSAVENIPEPRSSGQTGTPMETVPPRQLKAKRSGFLKFFNKSGSSSGNPNISSPITPIHLSHNGVELPPVPKLPAQYQTPKASPSELGSRRELPPVVVSSPALSRTQSLERSHSTSEDSHTSIGDHYGQSRFHQQRSNTAPPKPAEGDVSPQEPSFGSLKLRPVSSVFKGMPDDYLTGSPKVANSRGSGESRNGDSSGFEDSNVLSPSTPYFPQSARSCRTHVSTASSGSDAFSSSVDPRTPSSLGFPGSVPRSSTESHSASIIASLREQIESLRKVSQQQISDLQRQVQDLKAELDTTKCNRCGEGSNTNRPRAHTGTGSRPIYSYD